MNDFTTQTPSPQDFLRYGAVDIANSEVIKQSLYDFQIYATAGVQQLSYFSNPVGQGVTSALGAAVGSSKTYADTNLELGNQLPQGKAFMIESIEIFFVAGRDATANTFLPALPSLFAAANAASVAAQLNDVYTFSNSGWFELNISSKNMLREAPLGRFPQMTHLEMDVAAATTSATAGEVALVNGRMGGKPYYLESPIALFSGFNFEAKLSWPGAVATPSGFNARVGVIFDGYLLRARQ